MAEKQRHRGLWLAPIDRAHVVVPIHVALMTLAGAAVIDAVEFSVVAIGLDRDPQIDTGRAKYLAIAQTRSMAPLQPLERKLS